MRRKLLAVLLTLVMVFASAANCFAAKPTPTEDIVILHTNDAHCGYLPYDKVAAVAKDADLLIDAGDAVQGDVIGTLSKGEYVTDIMNYLGYDLATFGNHEFDYGMEQALHIANDLAKFPYVSCNFVSLETGKPVTKAYEVFEVKGVKIAFVGVTTPETFVKSTPTYFQDEDGNYIYSFCEGNNGKDLYNAVQKAVDAASAEADYVICVGHLGDDPESQPWTSVEVIANTTGVDAFIDGHSHGKYSKTVKNANGEDVVLQQTGTKLANVGKLVIKADGTIATELVPLADVEADPAATAYIKTITDKFDELQKTVVAKTLVDLKVNDEYGKRAVRNSETNLGDLCADAYRYLLDADVAIVNGGGVRAEIPAGDITFGQIVAVHPFGNAACLVEVTGQQILDALELGSSACPGELGGFLQVSGLTYTIDTRIPSSVVLNDKSEFVKVDGERRVKDVMVGGEPIDPAKTYKLASHNFMLKSAGDGYTMFGKNNVNILQDEVLIDNQVLINYITDFLGGVVGEEYAEAQGRIKILGNITEVDVTVEQPILGQHPDFAPVIVSTPEHKLLLEGEDYEVAWVCVDPEAVDADGLVMTPEDVFKEGFIYSFTVTFAAKEGYTFDYDLTKVTVNGVDLADDDADGFALFFPTELEDEEEIDLENVDLNGALLLYAWEEAIPCPHEKTETRGAVEPTCDKEGYTGDKYCTVCGELVEKGEVIPKLDHVDEDQDGKCDNCGKDLKSPETGIAFAMINMAAVSAAGIYVSLKKKDE